MKKKIKKSNKKEAGTKFNKDSALKALAKCPPKLYDLMAKGKSNIHELKAAGKCSGGKIRKMVWAGIAVINEDKTISLAKGIKKSNLPEVDPTPIKEKRAAKKEARESKDKFDKNAKESKSDKIVKKGKK